VAVGARRHIGVVGARDADGVEEGQPLLRGDRYVLDRIAVDLGPQRCDLLEVEQLRSGDLIDGPCVGLGLEKTRRRHARNVTLGGRRQVTVAGRLRHDAVFGSGSHQDVADDLGVKVVAEESV